ncbi:MAG: DUF1624 domain-containing protein [Solirubrobacterales bacterium]|nr:DUF1624 domain-containing protein [Solirubrobacterales bacterium]
MSATVTKHATPPPAAALIARPRLWEVDVLRTAAIAMMVVYHVAYNVRFLSPEVAIDPYNGGWRALQVVCASSFLTLVGVSFWIRDRRLLARGITGVTAWRTTAPRGGQVAAGALLVSLATFVALGDEAVRFGILHLIAVAHLLVLPLLVRLGAWNAVLGAVVIGGGLALDGTATAVSALMVVGLDPGETGVDWFPLLPWLGMPLLGVALGSVLYPDGRRHPRLAALGDGTRVTIAAGAPGRRSLTIYLLHQPVLIALTIGALLLTGTPIDGF